jgi:hypothetical protein
MQRAMVEVQWVSHARDGDTKQPHASRRPAPCFLLHTRLGSAVRAARERVSTCNNTKQRSVVRTQHVYPGGGGGGGKGAWCTVPGAQHAALPNALTFDLIEAAAGMVRLGSQGCANVHAQPAPTGAGGARPPRTECTLPPHTSAMQPRATPARPRRTGTPLQRQLAARTFLGRASPSDLGRTSALTVSPPAALRPCGPAWDALTRGYSARMALCRPPSVVRGACGRQPGLLHRPRGSRCGAARCQDMPHDCAFVGGCPCSELGRHS